jgi:hypothetical protein
MVLTLTLSGNPSLIDSVGSLSIKFERLQEIPFTSEIIHHQALERNFLCSTQRDVGKTLHGFHFGVLHEKIKPYNFK